MILTIVAAATDGADPQRFFEALASDGILACSDVEVWIVQSPSGPVRTAPPGVNVRSLGAQASIFELWGAGVRQAQADAIAILDVRCPPRQGWFAAMRAALPLSGAVIFGPVVCSMPPDDPNIVGYLTEYVQFNPPLDAASAEVPGVNFIATRSFLSDRRVLQDDGFVKSRLLTLLASSNTPPPQPIPGAVVDYQKPYNFAEYIVHRFRHGRCFGAQRPLPSPLQWIRAVASTPCLPALRSWRIFRNARRNPATARAVRRFWLRIGAAETAWSFGEFLGYVAGEGRARRHLR
ncbi:MAG: hypothetical protein SGJ21_04230 [Alphaproteobacteria bacterium]|nr:hypothetical protein [Alphaproteobacteria bacterium]